MAKSKLPSALRKHIRGLKARLRREGLSAEERRKRVAEFIALYKKPAMASSTQSADKKVKSVSKKKGKNKPAGK